MSFAARLVAATVFAIAGIAKIGDPQGTIRAVRAYRLLPEGAVHAVAYALPSFEIALAVLLFLGIAARVVGAIAAVALAVFVVAIVSAAIRGLRIDCGCFGGGGFVTHTHYLLEISRDVLLLLVILVIPLVTRSRFALTLPRKARAGLRVALPSRARSWARVLVVGVLAVAALGGIVANASNERTPAATAVLAPADVTAAGGILVGTPSAPVRLVAYEDPQCPVCGEFEKRNGAALEQAVKQGKVAVEYRMRSFLGVESVRADNALAAAQDEGKFELLREALFAHQPEEHTGGFTTDDLLELGRSVGLADAAYAGAVRSMKYAKWVAFVDDRASRDGNVGTPQLVKVGGSALSWDQTMDPVQFAAALGFSA